MRYHWRRVRGWWAEWELRAGKKDAEWRRNIQLRVWKGRAALSCCAEWWWWWGNLCSMWILETVTRSSPSPDYPRRYLKIKQENFSHQTMKIGGILSFKSKTMVPCFTLYHSCYERIHSVSPPREESRRSPAVSFDEHRSGTKFNV